MAFTRPLALILTAVLAYFAYLGRPVSRYGRGRAWAALVLRCLIVLLVVLSLAGAQSVRGSDALAVVFLVDASDSVPEREYQRALAFVDEGVRAMRPDDRAALVLFGADALVERPMLGGGELGAVASIPRTHQTDLAGALRLGMALFPAGAARRMVVLSDGRPTLGDAAQAVQLARAQGIHIDVVPLESGLAAETWVSGMRMPERLHPGEEFSLSVTVESTLQTEGRLVVLAGAQVAAEMDVQLNPGSNTFAVPMVAGEPGFADFRAFVTTPSDTYPQNNALSAYAMVQGPPRVLLVSEANGEDGDEAAALGAALEAAGLQVTRHTPSSMPSDPVGLAAYATVVLVDTPARAIPPRAMDALQTTVRDLGGGLVAVGGPDAYGVGGWYQTPLEEVLPVDMTIHDQQRFPPMAIVVIIDKSGSMSVTENGVQKIRLAGEAAARVAELINDVDEITVIAFDDRPADVIGPLPGSERQEVIDRAIRLQAGGGGIYVRESLEEALRHLAQSEAQVKHIILLSDGSDSEHQEGVRALVDERIAGEGITLSAVAIGAGPDLGFLQDIAARGGGRYYFTDRAATLPVIFAEETTLAMRSYIVEQPFYPRQTAHSPMLTGIDAVPQLAGYVATSPKPAAQVILRTHQDDPLLAAWQYGLGRSVAWTSDATGRWARTWVGWESFARFWAQVVRWTVVERSDVPLEMQVTSEDGVAHIALDAVDTGGQFVNGLQAAVSVVGPDGDAQQVPLQQTAPGHYEGRFTPEGEGAYVLRLAGTLDGQPAAALTSGWVQTYSPEYAALQDDPAYLAGLAELGGGRALDAPGQAFQHDLQGSGTRRDLAPWLLLAAALLLPLDVAVRRLTLTRHDLARAVAALRRRLPTRRHTPLPERPTAVARLFEAKARIEQEQRPEQWKEQRPEQWKEQRPEQRPEQPQREIPAVPPQAAPSAPAVDVAPARPAPPISPQPAPGQGPAGGETLAGQLLKRKREGRQGSGKPER